MTKIKSVQQNRELQKIFNAVFKKWDIGSDPLLDKRLHPVLVKIRKMVWSELFYKHQWTLQEIADVFDRNRSSIWRGIQKHNKL